MENQSQHCCHNHAKHHANYGPNCSCQHHANHSDDGSSYDYYHCLSGYRYTNHLSHRYYYSYYTNSTSSWFLWSLKLLFSTTLVAPETIYRTVPSITIVTIPVPQVHTFAVLETTIIGTEISFSHVISHSTTAVIILGATTTTN